MNLDDYKTLINYQQYKEVMSIVDHISMRAGFHEKVYISSYVNTASYRRGKKLRKILNNIINTVENEEDEIQ